MDNRTEGTAALLERDLLLVRPDKESGECDLGYWHRLAYANGLCQTRWLTAAAGIRSMAHQRVCVACLREEAPRWLTTWQVDVLPICTTHRIWLTDECPKCGLRISFRSSNFLTCRCGALFGHGCDVPVEDDVLDAIAHQHVPPKMLIWLGALATFDLGSRPQKRASNRRVRAVQALAQAGSAVIKDWPESFDHLLHRIRRPAAIAGRPQLVKEALPGLHRMINDLPAGAWRENIQAAVDAYVTRSTGTPDPISTPRTRPSEQQPSLKMLARDLGIGLRRLSKLIDTEPQKNLFIRRSGKGRRKLVVHEGHREILREQVEDALSLRRAAMLLGLRPQRVLALVDAGRLTQRRDLYSRRAVIELVRTLFPLFQSDLSSEEVVKLNEACRRWIRVKDTNDFLEAVRRGDIRSCPINAEQRLGDVLVSAQQARCWQRPATPSELVRLTIPEAALALGLKQQVVYDLVGRGFLMTHVHDKGARITRCVLADDLRLFRLEFEPLARIAKGAGIAHKQAYTWAVQFGMDVVTGPCVDGSRQYFVRRSTWDKPT